MKCDGEKQKDEIELEKKHDDQYFLFQMNIYKCFLSWCSFSVLYSSILSMWKYLQDIPRETN